MEWFVCLIGCVLLKNIEKVYHLGFNSNRQKQVQVMLLLQYCVYVFFVGDCNYLSCFYVMAHNGFIELQR